MDPTQATIDLLSALITKDIDQAKELFGDLVEWLSKGGFGPDAQQIRAYMNQE